jgi:hypothetical protein
MTTPTLQHFSTRNIVAADRFEYWDNVMSSTFTPFRLLGSAETYRNLSAAMTRATFGNLASSRESNNAIASERGPREISRSTAQNLTLLVSARGTWNLEHRGRVRLNEGDAVVLDSRFTHYLAVSGEHEVIAIDLPVRWLETWIPDLSKCGGHHFAYTDELSRFALQLTPEFPIGAPLLSSVPLDHLGGLLASSIGAVDKSTRARRALRQRIHWRVVDLCFDPDLTAESVAASLGTSVGDVHSALRGFGETFATVLIFARLGRARGQ